MVQPSKPKNQQRTAIVYFGPQWDDYLRLVEAADSAAFLRFVQHPLQQQLKAEKHRADCPDRSRYTSHGKRERTVQEWLGGQTVVPIYRVSCCGCGVVFTVLPSFILRYRRQEARLPKQSTDAVSRYGVEPAAYCTRLYLEWH